MWVIIKSVIAFCVTGLLVYALFFIDLGGKSLGGHIADVWRSPAVQQKVGLAKEGLRQKIEDELAEAAEKATRRAVRKELGKEPAVAHGDIDERDREALAEMLEGK